MLAAIYIVALTITAAPSTLIAATTVAFKLKTVASKLKTVLLNKVTIYRLLDSLNVAKLA